MFTFNQADNLHSENCEAGEKVASFYRGKTKE